MNVKRKTNWYEVILGVLFVVLGIATFFYTGAALRTFVIAYAILALIGGIVHIIGFYKLNKAGIPAGISLVSGILDIIVAILLFSNLREGMLVLALLFPIWFIMNCISQIAKLGIVKTIHKGSYWGILILNILGIIMGVMLMFNPLASAISMVYIIGLYLIFMGISSVVLGFNGYADWK